MDKIAKSLSTLALSAGLLASPVNSKAQGIVGDWLYNPTTQHEYALTTPGSWNDLRNVATANRGYLVSINTSAENQWLVNNFNPSSNFAIGLSDAVQEGNFRWESGEPLTHINWNPGEPNNGTSGNNAYMFTISHPSGRTPGTWDDYNGQSIIPGVVERVGVGAVPEPSTMLLLGSGALALLASRRRRR